MATEQRESTMSKIEEFQSLVEGDQLSKLRSIFLATGKGRRPKLPDVEMTNGLLIQLLILKQEGRKSFDDTATFLNQLFPDAGFSRLRYLLTRTEENVPHQSDLAQRKAFVSESVQIEQLGPFIRETGITSHELLNGIHAKEYASPSCGLLKDLLTFKYREQRTYKDMCQWWKQLTGNIVQETTLYHVSGKSTIKTAKLASNAHREKGKKAFEDFLLSAAFTGSSSEHTLSESLPLEPVGASALVPVCATASMLHDSESSTTQSEHSSSDLESTVTLRVKHLEKRSSQLVRKLAEGSVRLAAARRREEEQTKELSLLREKFSITVQTCQQYFSDIRRLEAEKTQAQASAEKAVLELQAGQQEHIKTNAALQQAKRKLNYYRRQGIQNKLRYRDQKLAEKDAQLETTKQLVQKHQEHRTVVTKKLRTLQLSHAHLKRRFKLLQCHCEKLKTELESEKKDRNLQPMD